MWKVLSCIIAAGVIAGEIQAKDLAWPDGTKVNASFRTEKDKGPQALIDGDASTWMMGAGGSCTSPTQATSVFSLMPSEPGRHQDSPTSITTITQGHGVLRFNNMAASTRSWGYHQTWPRREARGHML